MIRIAISPEAFAAICYTLPPGGVAFEHDRDDQGRVLVWLDRRAVNQLTAQRRAGEGYSEVILRRRVEIEAQRSDGTTLARAHGSRMIEP